MDAGRFLVIDIGTSSLKAAVMTADGEALSVVRRSIMRPSESVEQFASYRWTEALRDAIPSLVGHGPLDAVVLSGNGPTVVAVDASGEPLGPPLLWLDRRVAPLPDTRSFYLPRIAWFARERPEAERVRWYIPFPEYLVFMLTGTAVATTPSEEFSEFLWTGSERERYGISATTLPPFVPVGTIAGRVHTAGAEATGIPVGTPVVAAGSDFLMSLVGTDTLEPGRTCDRAGTSEGINHCTARPVSRPDLRTLPHVIPGLYNVAGILSSTGLLFEWFREISGQAGRDYGDMMTDIIAAGDRALADVPWFFPSLHRGAAWEFQRGMFIGLGSEHDRAAMGRAVVLSIGFAVREAIETLGDAGLEVASLRSCGGQAKNGIWNQMKADITGIPIEVPRIVDAELTGNLCAGLVALGRADSLREAASRVVHVVGRYDPDPRRTERYSEEYGHYRARYERFRSALEMCLDQN